MLAEDMSVNEILEEYPQLNREIILEAMALVAELQQKDGVSERRAY